MIRKTIAVVTPLMHAEDHPGRDVAAGLLCRDVPHVDDDALGRGGNSAATQRRSRGPSAER